MSAMEDVIDFPGAPEPRIEAVPVTAFDPARQQWVDSPPTSQDAALTSLSCITFNTWFQGPEAEARYGGLLDVLERSDADVILLQEVTTRLLDMLQGCGWIRAGYRLVQSPIRADAIPSHGVVLLSRLPLVAARVHPLPTRMGRCLLEADSRVNGATFTFATAHLESMKPYADERGRQLKYIFSVIGRSAHCVLGGDFNFCSSWREENSRLDPAYVDVWPALRPAEPGYTQDTDINRMLAAAKQETRKVRFDRILLRSAAGKGHWMPATVSLAGTEPVSPLQPRIFPSDHFGLVARLRCAG